MSTLLNMTRITRVFPAIALAVLLHPGLLLAQAQEHTVYAGVLDRTGAPLLDLSAQDFTVREDGTQREVLRVAPATDPLRIAVLVDTSQAMERHVSDLRNALRAFFKEAQGRHEIALVAFGERPTVLANYTRDPAVLEAAVGRVFSQSGSGAYVLDAIIEVSQGLRARDGHRPVIVVITAQGPEFSEQYHRTVVDELRDTEAALYSFVLTTRPGLSFVNEAARERDFALSNGSEVTGGQREDLLTSLGLPLHLQVLAAELNNQYQIVYARPRALIPPETIDVRVNRPGVTVHAPRTPKRRGTTF